MSNLSIPHTSHKATTVTQNARQLQVNFVVFVVGVGKVTDYCSLS